jgi:hypothetical protein
MKKVGGGMVRVFSLFLIFSLSFVLCSKKVVKKFVRWVKKLFLVFFSGWFFRRKPEKERERREREKGRGKACPGARKHMSVYYWLKNLTYDQIQISRLTDRHSLRKTTERRGA